MTAPFPSAEMPVATPMHPSTTIPPGACDTHIHMVGGPGDFAANAPRRRAACSEPQPSDTSFFIRTSAR
ncbi:MAG: hypothetical protein AAF376_11895, partial [Pseudomonadota bacterium]